MASETHLPGHRYVELSTHGIVYLGTPHLGADVVPLARALLQIQSVYQNTSDAILKDIGSESHAIDTQLSQYTSISNRYYTKFFYEQMPTLLMGRLSKMVRLLSVYHALTDLVFQLVPRSSAVVPGAPDAEAVGLNTDHIGLAKFGRQEDGGGR